jgi:hypothetical protein
MGWPRSIRWRYSLRALFVFITLFMLWGGYHVERGAKERAAEAVLVGSRGEVTYGPERSPGIGGSVTYWYQKVVQTIWRERYITSVTLYADRIAENPLTDEEVEAIASLPYLRGLGIGRESFYRGPEMFDPKLEFYRRVPDGTVSRILARCRLRELGITKCKLGDADFRAIGDHSSLESLKLGVTNISDKHLGPIVRLPRLRELYIRDTKITGAGLASQPGSESLERIYSGWAPIGVEFADFVARCPRVTCLEASHQSVDDEFVRRLEGHPALEELHLSWASVTDRCIPSLLKIPSLTLVSLFRSKVTPQGAIRLRQARPATAVGFK